MQPHIVLEICEIIENHPIKIKFKGNIFNSKTPRIYFLFDYVIVHRARI